MKRIPLKKLTAACMIAAGILAVDSRPSMAQRTSDQDTYSQNSSAKNSGNAMNQKDVDATFIQKVSEGNLAEIELGKLALEKASAQAVKDFAQLMISHHTKAKEQFSNIVSGFARADDSNQSDVSRGTTTVDDDANTEDGMIDPQKTATLGGTGGTTGNSPANGSNTRSTDPERNVSDGTGGGGAGANSGGTTSSPSSGVVSGTDQNEKAADTRNNSSETSTAATISKSDSPKIDKLSAEHMAVKDKLSKLSRAEFDKAYMQAMVKDHAKTIELFEMEISKGQNAQLVNFAKTNLPMIQEHYQKAQAISEDK